MAADVALLRERRGKVEDGSWVRGVALAGVDAGAGWSVTLAAGGGVGRGVALVAGAGRVGRWPQGRDGAMATGAGRRGGTLARMRVRGGVRRVGWHAGAGLRDGDLGLRRERPCWASLLLGLALGLLKFSGHSGCSGNKSYIRISQNNFGISE